MDSPTRRSSIPILKQTNKTKSFQSYVNLNLNDDSGRSESSSSVCTSPSVSSTPREQPKLSIKSPILKTSSIDIDNDIIITKLCEENKKLKETQQNLIAKYEEALRENMEIQHQNDSLQQILNDSKKSQGFWKEKIDSLEEKLEKENCEKIQLKNSIKMLNQEIENFKMQQMEYNNVIEKNKKLQKKLEEILPENLKDLLGDENSEADSKLNVNLPSDLKNIMNELEKLKIYLNKADLQLYEANEKISELEDENSNLKGKNKELNEYVKIMSTNIRENMDAHKKIQDTFKMVKEQRDDLLIKNRDSIDSPNQLNVNEEIRDLKTELKRQKAVYEAQFIEYTNLKEELLRKTTELEEMSVELENVRGELKMANERAHCAEEKLKKINEEAETEKKMNEMVNNIPPPPPPPLALFSSTPMKPSSSSASLSDAISQTKLLASGSPAKQSKGLEGLDAVISDLRNTIKRRKKSPAVVLRNKVPDTSDSTSESDTSIDKSYIINLVESNSKQNRRSLKMCDNELSLMFNKFNLNNTF